MFKYQSLFVSTVQYKADVTQLDGGLQSLPVKKLA